MTCQNLYVDVIPVAIDESAFTPLFCILNFNLQSFLAVFGTMSFAIVEWRNYKVAGEQMNTSLNKGDYKSMD